MKPLPAGTPAQVRMTASGQHIGKPPGMLLDEPERITGSRFRLSTRRTDKNNPPFVRCKLVVRHGNNAVDLAAHPEGRAGKLPAHVLLQYLVVLARRQRGFGEDRVFHDGFPGRHG